MPYAPQVTKGHYYTTTYDTKDRWISYWYQIHFALKSTPLTLLEIGQGNGTTRDALKKRLIAVTTVDIAPDLHPDVVASVTDLPFTDNAFDVVLAAEVLEHLPFADVPRALSEIRRVARECVVISLPHAGYVFSLTFKIPLLRRVELIWKLPFFWKEHQFNGEHYWELGKKGYPVSRIKKEMRRQGFLIREARLYPDDPAHCFFLLKKV